MIYIADSNLNARDTAKHKLRSLLAALNKLRNHRKEGNICLLISFDQADCLGAAIDTKRPIVCPKWIDTKSQAYTPSPTYYTTLLRCVTYWKEHQDKTLVVFASSTELPEESIDPIYAYRYHEYQPVPIVDTPFDCSPALPLRENDVKSLTLSDITCLEFMAQFGRPL